MSKGTEYLGVVKKVCYGGEVVDSWGDRGGETRSLSVYAAVRAKEIALKGQNRCPWKNTVYILNQLIRTPEHSLRAISTLPVSEVCSLFCSVS